MAENQELKVINQPVCRHLLSKGMFVTGQLDPQLDPVEPTDDGHCWCNQTQNVLGPDDQLVERAACTPTRACYEAR